VLLTEYVWSNDDQLTEVRRDFDASGRNVRYTMSYAAGLQTRTVKTVAGAVSYTVEFSYDARGRVQQARFDRLGDGSVDAVWTLRWEDAPCVELVLPVWDPLIDTRTGWRASLRGETGRCGN